MKADSQGRRYAHLDRLVECQKVWLDGGFTCAEPGPVIVRGGAQGLYFECAEGRHYLDGQDDGDGYCVGVYLEDPGPLAWEHGERAA